MKLAAVAPAHRPRFRVNLMAADPEADPAYLAAIGIKANCKVAAEQRFPWGINGIDEPTAYQQAVQYIQEARTAADGAVILREAKWEEGGDTVSCRIWWGAEKQRPWPNTGNLQQSYDPHGFDLERQQ